MPIKGASAMAVLNDSALFARPYRRKDVVWLVDLNTRDVEEIIPTDLNGNAIIEVRATEEIRLDGETWNRETVNYRAFARGSKMYLLTEANDLFVVDVRDI
jgi:hypothetical protein